MTVQVLYKVVKVTITKYTIAPSPTIADPGTFQNTLNDEPPLGVIREQGEWPLRPKGARSMA